VSLYTWVKKGKELKTCFWNDEALDCSGYVNQVKVKNCYWHKHENVYGQIQWRNVHTYNISKKKKRIY